MGTLEEWDTFTWEIEAMDPDIERLPTYVWLSATEGDIGKQLGRPGHWPEGVEAREEVWRDYYTGIQLNNFTKPWMFYSSEAVKDVTKNCILLHLQLGSWKEFECKNPNIGCPCHYQEAPIVRLRGACPGTAMEQIYNDTLQFRVLQISGKITYMGSLIKL